jgi:serine/threonine protein phosphatase 1
MSTIAVGDIHGRADLLGPLLKRLRKEIKAEDHLVFLGDYVDRGPDVKSCFDLLTEWCGDPPCRTVFLMGNHEECMLRARNDHTCHSWLTAMEGLSTIASYDARLAGWFREQLHAAGPRLYREAFTLPYDRFFALLPSGHLEILDSLRIAFETNDAVCVHAAYDPNRPIDTQDRALVLWGARFPRGYRGGRKVIYGHHANAIRKGNQWMPRICGRTYGIDTVAQNVLTAFRLPDGAVFQVPKAGYSLNTIAKGFVARMARFLPITKRLYLPKR